MLRRSLVISALILGVLVCENFNAIAQTSAARVASPDPASCEARAMKAEWSVTPSAEHSPAWFESNDEVAKQYLGNVLQCHLLAQEYVTAVNLFDKIKDHWNGKDEIFVQYDPDHLDVLTRASLLDHLALAAEKIGEHRKARLIIRKAHLYNFTDQDSKIEHDYHRIDAAQIAAERRALDESVKRDVDADFKKWALQSKRYSGDQKDTVRLHGLPCRVTTSDSTYLGRMEIWYYGCEYSGEIGNESFTFINSKLKDHTTL